MDVDDDQAEGRACMACRKPGEARDNVPVGIGDAGDVVWACPGGCVVICGLTNCGGR